VIPEAAERRARWVLDTIGAREVGFGDDLPYRAEAWEQVDRGERPTGDDLAEAFFHLARVEERNGARDEHDRFRAESSCLDPLDPPLERLRRKLGVEAPRWSDARFAVALTHDVDVPWKWTRKGVKGAAARAKSDLSKGRARSGLRELRGLAGAAVHKVTGTDPYWSFDRILDDERRNGASSTFFLLADHAHEFDGAAVESYERLRPRLVETLQGGGAEIGLHGSYSAADDPNRIATEKERLEQLSGPVSGQRYHYLRIDPHRNLAALEAAGFAYDSSLGFGDAIGFRAGIAHPFRPWDLERDAPRELVEVPLAAMDVTLSAERYLNLGVDEAERRLMSLLDWAAENGGGFAVLWHSEQYDSALLPGWDRLYRRVLEGVRARDGVCLQAGALAEEARAWLS
jgi:peptidoglycan/xylan/chitin deacetylase (PgdA/CDA1 family)